MFMLYENHVDINVSRKSCSRSHFMIIERNNIMKTKLPRRRGNAVVRLSMMAPKWPPIIY